VHRPLTLTALAFFGDGDEHPFVLVAADIGWWKSPEDGAHALAGVVEAAGGDPARALVHLSHTHAGPSATLLDGDPASVEYLDQVRAAAAEAAREAVRAAQPAVLATAVGRCSLAANRDFSTGDRFVVAFNPDVTADDTVVVGRITTENGELLATLVNYACHPTTLAWQNTLISPDFVGGAREVVEAATGAPCVFLQGASGELAPRHEYVGDIAVADRHGRSLGHAAMSALEAMPPPGSALTFAGVVESGAALGMWEPKPYRPPSRTAAARIEVELRLRPLATLEELEEQWRGIDPISLTERLRRARVVRAFYGGRSTYLFPVWIWQLGECLAVGVAGEAYSQLQLELRSRHPEHRIFVLGVTNTELSAYLPDEQAYDRDVYQAWQTPYARGSLEQLIEAVDEALSAVLAANGS
jgi:hypothetical protein